MSKIFVPGEDGLVMSLMENPSVVEEESWTFEIEIILPDAGQPGPFQGIDTQVDRASRDLAISSGLALVRRVSTGKPFDGHWNGMVVAEADLETPAVVMAWGTLPEIGDVAVSAAHSESSAQAQELLKSLTPGLRVRT